MGSNSKLGAKSVVSKKYKFTKNCYICDKSGHRSFECRSKQAKANGKRSVQAHMAEADDMDLCAMMSEVNLPHEWWVDTGVTHHVY